MGLLTKEEMLSVLGSPNTNQVVPRFQRLAFLPDHLIMKLADLALSENWGKNSYVLRKYLAVHVPWAIEQGRFTTSENQLYVTAGHLQTRYGTPLFLVFEENKIPGKQRYCLVHVGHDISAFELPSPPDIPSTPDIPTGLEIVMLHDHILGENEERIPFLSQTPPVAQMCAVAGSIQWSLNRKLQLPYWYYGRMQFLVPLYLQSRENITEAPDLIAPIQVDSNSLLVRTVLLPHMPYANARVAVSRHDQLPHWMLESWKDHASHVTEKQIDNPELENNGS